MFVAVSSRQKGGNISPGFVSSRSGLVCSKDDKR